MQVQPEDPPLAPNETSDDNETVSVVAEKKETGDEPLPLKAGVSIRSYGSSKRFASAAFAFLLAFVSEVTPCPSTR